MDKKIEEIKDILKKYDQEHLLNHYDKLDEKHKKQLIEQIENIDFALIKSLYQNANKEEKNEDILEFIEKIKTDRNHAQDQISEVKKILGLPEDTDLVEHFKKSLDKQQQVE